MKIIFNPLKEIAWYFLFLFKLIPVRTHIVLHSGRGVTKSTFLAMWNLWRLMYYKNADGIVIVFERGSIGKKVWGNYKDAARFLHIQPENIHFHKGGINSDWYIRIKNIQDGSWNTIFFEHGKGGAEQIKGFHPTDNHRWLFASFYELTNFINWDDGELTSIHATFLRDTYANVIWEEVEKYCKEHDIEFKQDYEWLIDQKWTLENYEKFYTKEFCFEYEFNTPSPGPSQWVMEWIDNFKKRDDVWWQFNTYKDMTPRERLKFLKPNALKEIEQLKINNPIKYNHEWLGMEDYNGDASFTGLSKKTHLGWHKDFRPDEIVIGVDVGTDDPTVCVANGFEYIKKDLRVQLGMHCWYYCKRRQWYIKDSKRLPFPPPNKQWKLENYAQMIREFCDMVHYEYPHVPIYIQFDRHGAGKLFYDETFKYNGLKYLHRAEDWEGVSLFTRFNTINDLIHTAGVLKIADEFVFNAYKNQINDKKHEMETGQVKRLDAPKNIRLNLDTEDATEYGIRKRMYREIRERLKDNGGRFNWDKEKERERNRIFKIY